MFGAPQNRFGSLCCQIIFLPQDRAVDIFLLHFIYLILASTMRQAGVGTS
jgi:hypothetical protein